MKVVIVKIGHELYALNIDHVISIEKIPEIRPLPNTSIYFEGLMRYRDRVIPVVSLKEWLALLTDTNGDPNNQRIVVLDGNSTVVGLRVDEASDVMDIEETMLQEWEHTTVSTIQKVIQLGEQIVLLFEINEFLEEFRKHY